MGWGATVTRYPGAGLDAAFSEPRRWILIACDPDELSEEFAALLASKASTEGALVVGRAGRPGSPLAQLAGAARRPEGIAGKEVCWAGPGPERRWHCRQAIEGASLELGEDTAVWTTLEGAPLIAARKVGRGVVATLGCHPSAARDAAGAATVLLRQKRLQCTQATTRYTGAEALCCQAASSTLTAKGCSSLRTIRSSPASQPSPVSSKMCGSNMATHADTPLSTPHRRASRRRRPSIVVVYGTPANNLGDDAMLTAVVRDIQTIEPDAEVTVLAETPEYCGPLAEQLNAPIEESLQQFLQTFLKGLKPGERAPLRVLELAEHLGTLRDRIISGEGVEEIPPRYLPGLRRLMTADGVVGCGVAIMDHWKSYTYERWLLYLLAPKPLLISGMGLDHFADPDDVQVLLRAFARANEITLRERISEKYLRVLGCRTTFHTTGDDALTLPPSPKADAEKLLEAAGVDTSKPYLAFHYRHFLDYEEDRFLFLFAQYVDEAIAALGLPVVGIPMHFYGTDERPRLRALAERTRQSDRFHVVEAHLSPADAKALFALAEVAFGISYHSAIFSLSSETPFLGLYRGDHYTQKMQGLSALYRFPELPVPVDLTPPAAFGQRLKSVFDRRANIASGLKRRQRHLLKEVIDSRVRFLVQVRQKMD